MIPYIYNDGGRAASGRKGDSGDCMIRAAAIATGERYDYVYVEFFEMGWRYDYKHAVPAMRRARKAGVHNVTGKSRTLLTEFLVNRRGWLWTPTMSIGSGCTLHLGPDPLPETCIVRLSKHVAAIVLDRIHDNHDPRRNGTRCVYGYWTPPKKSERRAR
jgi:hypothetical protein